MPAPVIQNFTPLVTDGFKSIYGTQYFSYTGYAGIHFEVPAGYELYSISSLVPDPTHAHLVIREKKTVQPPPIHVEPGLPPIDYRKAQGNPRGDGLRVTKDIELSNICFDGFRMGIDHDRGAMALRNVRIINSLRNNDTSEIYLGSACYSGPNAGPVTHDRCLMLDNGWQEGVPPHWKTSFSHNWYADTGAGLLSSISSIYAGASFAGIQSRSGAVILHPLLLGNTVGVLAVGGKVRIEDGFFFDCDVANMGGVFDGGIGVAAWTDVELVRCTFVGRKKPLPPRGVPKWFPSCIQINKGHKKNPNGAGRVLATDCKVYGWPGPLFGGPVPPPSEGFAVLSNEPVDYDWRPTIARVLKNEISVMDANVTLRSEILSLARV